MLTIQDNLILKRKVYLQNGQQATKTYKLVRYRHKSQSTQIYDVYDSQLTQQFTLKIMIKNQQLSKQKSINEIKNQQLFVGLPNFISLYDIYEDNQKIYLVMEKWGDTLADLTNERATMTEYEVQMVFSQLVDIVVELRKANIAHNFITLESLYIDIKQKHKIKLGDFKKSFNVASYFETFLPQNNRKLSLSNLDKLQKKLKENNPIHMNLASKQPNQKFTCYSSPEEVSSSHIQDYTKFLANLYENDIWNIGIILFRLLMGRFPFEEEQADDLKYAFEMFVDKKEYEFTNKKQCCFTFYQKGNSYCEPISIQFKQLIKSLLKPAHKRIKLKDLLDHPLKLNTYHNLMDLNFEHHLPPLMALNNPVYTPLKPIKPFLFENYLLTKDIQLLEDEQNRLNSNARLLQSNSSNFFQTQSHKQNSDQSSQNYRKNKKNHSNNTHDSADHFENVKFLSPKSNFSLFSVFNDQQPVFTFETSPQASLSSTNQKYFYTWNINFAEPPQLQTQVSISGPITQSQLQAINSDKKSQAELNSRRLMGQKTSMFNLGKTTPNIKGSDNYEQQSEPNNNNSEQNEKDSNTSKHQSRIHKRVPSASFQKREQLRSFHNVDNYENNMARSTISNSQFNIRSINSKKNLMNFQAHPEKKPTFDSHQASNESSSNPSDKTNLYGGSLSNSRLAYSKQSSQKSNGSSNKIALRRYQGKSDAICENDESTERGNFGFSDQHKQGQLKLKSSFLQEREAQLLILRNQVAQFPLLVEQPEFVLQYKFKKQQNSLGYVLNNGIGVIFQNGKQVIGHNQNDFIILKKDMKLEDSMQFQIKKGSKSSFDLKTLTSSQIFIYQEYLKFFGKRMVISNFSIWIHKYWKIGKIFVFLFNNGSWQVTLQGKKTSKFFIVDENQLIWTKGRVNPEVLNQVRNIVNRKRYEIIQQEYFFK